MTDAPEIAAAPVPAPVRARALAGLIDLVPSDALILVLGKAAGQTGFIIGLVGVVASFSALEANGGQTPGKRLMGLEVRHLDGAPCDLRSAIIRNVFRFLDWFPGVYVIGGFAIVSNKRRQRLGDQAAGTSVYRRADL
ncbi:MAG: hypothetical protein QOH00_363 [Gaiellales bacterium]|jgi:uncharacterized RDD family membrane protein YckC|nr:hypothetical protein [Gaiellales bacterium]